MRNFLVLVRVRDLSGANFYADISFKGSDFNYTIQTDTRYLWYSYYLNQNNYRDVFHFEYSTDNVLRQFTDSYFDPNNNNQLLL